MTILSIPPPQIAIVRARWTPISSIVASTPFIAHGRNSAAAPPMSRSSTCRERSKIPLHARRSPGPAATRRSSALPCRQWRHLSPRLRRRTVSTHDARPARYRRAGALRGPDTPQLPGKRAADRPSSATISSSREEAANACARFSMRVRSSRWSTPEKVLPSPRVKPGRRRCTNSIQKRGAVGIGRAFTLKRLKPHPIRDNKLE